MNEAPLDAHAAPTSAPSPSAPSDRPPASSQHSLVAGQAPLTPPARLELFLTLGLVTMLSLVFAYVAMVEVGVSIESRGVLLSQGAVGRLTAAKAGTVGAIYAKSDETVASGEPLLKIDHPRAGIEDTIALLEQRREQLNRKLERVRQGGESAAATEIEDQLEMSLLEVENRLQSMRTSVSTLVSAPRSGRLIDFGLREGQTVRQGQPLGSVVDDQPEFRAVAYIDASLAGKVEVGTPATIGIEPGRWDAPSVMTGKAVRIARLPVPAETIDPTMAGREPQIEVEIEIDPASVPASPPKPLTPGMPVPIKLHADERSIVGWVLQRFER
ncbi:MAG: HlyD family efflux transporter periplasmic adaptor subunit [Lysobacter sp.]|nr:MAG: HlyD family efflux transporter periplasmic adaptor subunit [Lysobacter sp.]